MMAANSFSRAPLKFKPGISLALFRTLLRALPYSLATCCCLAGMAALAACGPATDVGGRQPPTAASARADVTTPAKPTNNENAVEIAIQMKGFMFHPATITVPTGTTVRWRNGDDEVHTVASVDGKFRSGALDRDDSFSFRFETAGTYRYVCSIHPQMVGEVVVRDEKSLRH